jgi:hypothetical protein
MASVAPQDRCDQAPQRQSTKSVRRTATFDGTDDYSIADGWNLRFLDDVVERAYRREKSEMSQAAMLSVWMVFLILSVVWLVIAAYTEPWDYAALPAGAYLIFAGRVCILLLVQIPLLLWAVGPRLPPGRVEWAMYATTFLGIVCAGGPMNCWRASVVMHGDGQYLFDVIRAGTETSSKPSETLFVTCYCGLFALFYLRVPLVRASRAWIHMLACYAAFICILLPPGMSPESPSTLGMEAIFMAFYLHSALTVLFKAERADRFSWASKRLLEEESRDLFEAEEGRRQRMIASVSESHERQLLEALRRAVETDEAASIAAAKKGLLSSRWPASALDSRELMIRKQQSEERGVTLSYLLSDEFEELARTSSGLEDPSFHDLVQPFFLGPDAIGHDKICPRDGRRGCALVDSLPFKYRKRCTHFLSWTWSSKISTVREALKRWADRSGSDPAEVSFYMCFFVNNQYRILAPDAGSRGSDTLGETFERNLLRTKRMVAVLDTFDKPTYLTRIWTIFEQFTAMRLGVEVEVTLPSKSRDALIAEFERGREGIMRVRDAMSTVDSSSARASDPADELKVKSKILESVGFNEVDAAIKRVMCGWVAAELRAHMDEIMHDGCELEADGSPLVVTSTESRAGTPFDLYEFPSILTNLFARAATPSTDDLRCGKIHFGAASL